MELLLARRFYSAERLNYQLNSAVFQSIPPGGVRDAAPSSQCAWIPDVLGMEISGIVDKVRTAEATESWDF